MIEFVIGLVAMLAILAGLLQLVSLSEAHLDTMSTARQEAGRRAFFRMGTVDNADYIRHWNDGADERSYSRDDEFNRATPNAFRLAFPDKAGETPNDWRVMESVPYNPIDDMRDVTDPADAFGLVSARETRDVPLLPAVRHLLYRADQIEIESEVWMTSTYGIY